MDYALEYALMGELYDEAIESNANVNNGLKDYMDTRTTKLGKFAAAVKYIWSKIIKVLGQILTFIPRVIGKWIQKIKGREVTSLKDDRTAAELKRLVGLYSSDVSRTVSRIIVGSKRIEKYMDKVFRGKRAQKVNEETGEDANLEPIVADVERSIAEVQNSKADIMEKIRSTVAKRHIDYNGQESERFLLEMYYQQSKDTIEKYQQRIAEIKSKADKLFNSTVDPYGVSDMAGSKQVYRYVEALDKFSVILMNMPSTWSLD